MKVLGPMVTISRMTLMAQNGFFDGA